MLRFMISMSAGRVIANNRLTRRPVSIRSRLATSKRPSSCSVRTKARMTRMPARVSRMTRLMRSILSCIAWNSGTALNMTTPMTTTMMGMMNSRIPVSGMSCRRAMITPPTSMIGAVIIMFRAISTNCWTCVTSLVLRVMRVAAPKWLTSTWLNLSTWRKIAERTSRPMPIEIRADQYTPMMAAIISANVTTSM